MLKRMRVIGKVTFIYLKSFSLKKWFEGHLEIVESGKKERSARIKMKRHLSGRIMKTKKNDTKAMRHLTRGFSFSPMFHCRFCILSLKSNMNEYKMSV